MKQNIFNTTFILQLPLTASGFINCNLHIYGLQKAQPLTKHFHYPLVPYKTKER